MPPAKKFVRIPVEVVKELTKLYKYLFRDEMKHFSECTPTNKEDARAFYDSDTLSHLRSIAYIEYLQSLKKSDKVMSYKEWKEEDFNTTIAENCDFESEYPIEDDPPTGCMKKCYYCKENSSCGNYDSENKWNCEDCYDEGTESESE